MNRNQEHVPSATEGTAVWGFMGALTAPRFPNAVIDCRAWRHCPRCPCSMSGLLHVYLKGCFFPPPLSLMCAWVRA